MLRELDFSGLSLNRKTILSIFEKLHGQIKAMSSERKKEMSENLPLSEDVDLAIRLTEIPLLQDRINVLKFKELLRSEYDDIINCANIVSNAADHILTTSTLKNLLQIIVQAINQRLKDFAKKENVDFDQYKVLGVPASDILTFMGQKKPMEIIAEKTLMSGLVTENFKILGLNEACNIHLTERIYGPSKRLNNEFNKIKKVSKPLKLSKYIEEITDKLDTMQSIISQMSAYLRKASVYLGETESFMEINAGSKKYNIIELVDSILQKWRSICKEAIKNMKKKPKEDCETLKNIIEKSNARRRSMVQHSEDDWSD